MAEMLSPGVFVTEINASTIVPTVSSSVGVFCGDFVKGPVGAYTLITTVAELINFYGNPTNFNYNDFYQAYNFLNYGNKLLVARAANSNGLATQASVAGVPVVTANAAAIAVGSVAAVSVSNAAAFTAGVSEVAFETTVGAGADLTNIYQVTAVDTVLNTITLSSPVAIAIPAAAPVYTVQHVMNALVEPVSSGLAITPAQLYANNLLIENDADYLAKELSIPFSSATSKLKIIARNPGAWANNIEVAIATPAAFGLAVGTEAFPGIALDSLFEYAPIGTEVGVIIRENGIIVETWIGDFNINAKDFNNKSKYIEDVINTMSQYVYCKDNTANTAPIQDYVAVMGAVDAATAATLVATNPGVLVMSQGTDSPIQNDDLALAYDLFSNKEQLDIDIVIANELDAGVSANTLCTTRADCIGFIGANYADVVGQKSAIAVGNLINWRKTGSLNINNMFLVACANYKYQYDKQSVALCA